MEQAGEFGGVHRTEALKPTIFDVAAIESTKRLLHEFVKELVDVLYRV